MRALTWRLMGCDMNGVFSAEQAARDEVAARRLHADLEAMAGRKLDRPDLLGKPVLITVLGETDGVVTHGFYLEAEIEACAMGAAPLASRELAAVINLFLLPVAQQYGIRIARCFVPSALIEGPRLGERKRPLHRLLERMGFTLEQGKVSQFYRWLVPAAESLPTGDAQSGESGQSPHTHEAPTHG